jgi:GDSL-like Lipase/Acylhydrolase family
MKPPALTLLVALAVLCGRSVGADKPAATPEINLPRAYDKLVDEKKLVVGFMGASVMAGANATSAQKTSWRALVTQALQAQYPDARIEAVNTSVGGRGADYANFHFRYDTLPKKPDLIFTDAYCNGPYGDEEVRCNEGLIRQIRQALPNAEIVFVYIYKKSGGGVDRFYAKGEMSEAQLHGLCGHYGIPDIDLAKVFYDAFQAKPDRRLLSDSVHPNDAGHKIYADAVMQFLKQRIVKGDIAAQPMPQPFKPSPMENPNVIDAQSTVKLNFSGWLCSRCPWLRQRHTGLCGVLDHFIDGLAKLFVDRHVVLAMHAAAKQCGTAPDVALVFIAPLMMLWRHEPRRQPRNA